MKIHMIILLLTMSQGIFGQSSELAGNYEFFKGNGDSHYLKDRITLNPNGTFLFTSESYIEERLVRKRLAYGKGTWTNKSRLIFLKVETSDIDATHTLDLNMTKLRFDTKSPRDRSGRDIKTSVRIIDTGIDRLKGRTLIKDAKTEPVLKEKKCCESVWQVHSYLHGKWKNKSKPNNEYHYSFKEEPGAFHAFEKSENGTLEPIDSSAAKVMILKTSDGYKIEQDFNGLKTVSTIRHLDSKKLILSRKDGKESVLFRVEE